MTDRIINRIARRKPIVPAYVRRGIFVGLVSAACAYLAMSMGVLDGVEEWTLDWCFKQRGARATSAKIVIIDIDDGSLERVNKLPFELSPELTTIVKYLKAHGAGSVGIDLRVPNSIAKRLDERPGRLSAAKGMGQACSEAGNVVLGQRKTDMGQWELPFDEWMPASEGASRLVTLPFMDLTDDPDHFLRQQSLVLSDNGKPLFHFSTELLRVAKKSKVEWDGKHLRLDGHIVPLDEKHGLFVNYVGPTGSFPTIKLWDILQAAEGKRELPVDLRDAVVIIGTVSGNRQDSHTTPYANNYFHWLISPQDGLMSGTEFFGHVVATLWDRAYILHPTWMTPLITIFLGVTFGIIYARLTLRHGVFFAFLYYFVWRWIVGLAFTYGNIRLPMLPVMITGAILVGLTFALRWRLLRSMLGVVQSENIARLLEDEGASYASHGEERQITVMFVDIRSFTSFSECHSPAEVVRLLNAYFSAVVPFIEAEGGTVNKYLGDGILAWFGWPEERPDHPLRSVRAAVAMVAEVHRLKDEWTKLGNPGMRIGVGLHTGPVVVGTIGSRNRMEYTAIGDTVNAASRIESENKPLKSEILISQTTFEFLTEADRASLSCEAAATPVLVKGKEQPLNLHIVRVP